MSRHYHVINDDYLSVYDIDTLQRHEDEDMITNAPTYTITTYQEPLAEPIAPDAQQSAMNLQHATDLNDAIRVFLSEIIHLDTGCVQIWNNDREIGRFYL